MAFKYCPECGYKFDKEYKFCPECGYKLNQSNTSRSINNDFNELDNLENLFDKQLLEKEKEDKIYQNKLTAAKILILKEEYDKAINAYNEILNDVVDDIVPYIGLIQAVSKNFTVIDEKSVNEQVDLLFDLFKKDDCLLVDKDFSKFIKERDAHFFKLQEIERKKIEDQKKKEAEYARLQKWKEKEEERRQIWLEKQRIEKENNSKL